MVRVGMRPAPRAFQQFNKAFQEGHAKSLKRAVQGVSFKHRTGLKAFISQGGSRRSPPRAPLSRHLGKNRRERRALRFLSNFVAYKVRPGRFGRGWESLIGVDVPFAGARRRPSRRQLQVWLGGARVRITRARQHEIIRKARARGRKLWYRDRGEERSIIPEEHAIVTFPERPLIEEYAERHAGQVYREIPFLYEKAQRGERWARDWWR